MNNQNKQNNQNNQNNQNKQNKITKITKINPIVIFTDGSYIAKVNKCGYGVLFPNKEFKDISRKFTHEPLTNQRAELYAIYKSIKRVNDADINLPIKIYSDSEYSIKSLTIWIKTWQKNGWKSSTGKSVMNQDIIKDIYELMTAHKAKIEFQHVRAHTGKQDEESKNNDIVDKLAKDGANK
jgi:ribonuclease HI